MEEKKELLTIAGRKRPEDQFIISEETAEDQLVRWMNYYQIYPDEIQNSAERMTTENTINKLLPFIRQGMVEFRDDGTFTQFCQGKKDKPLGYKALTGRAKIQNKESTEAAVDAIMTKRQYAMMASLCALPAAAILDFHALDMSVVECVSFLLSSV